MGQQKQPPNPAQVAAFAVLAVAKATVHRVRGKREPHSKNKSRSLARQWSSEEMAPLHEARRIQSLRGLAPAPVSPWEFASSIAILVVKLLLMLAAAVLAGMHEQWPIVILCSVAFLVEAVQAAFTFGRSTALGISIGHKHKGSAKKEAAPSKAKEGKEGKEGQEGESKDEAPPGTKPHPKLSGTWHKVDALSESQDEAAKLMKIGGLAKKAMTMFKGMEFKVDDKQIASTAIVKIPFFKAPTETYKLDGSISSYPRRDMRKGNFNGYIKVQKCGGVNLYYSFDEPLAGHCCDEIRMISDDEMHITTHLTIGEESTAYKVVYYRAGSELEKTGRKDSGASNEASMDSGEAKAGDGKAEGKGDKTTGKGSPELAPSGGSASSQGTASSVSVTATAAKVTVVPEGKEQDGSGGLPLVGPLVGALGGLLGQDKAEGKGKSRRSSAMQSPAGSEALVEEITTPAKDADGDASGSAYSSGTEGANGKKRGSRAPRNGERNSSRKSSMDDVFRKSNLAPTSASAPPGPVPSGPQTPPRGIVGLAGSVAQAVVGGVVGGVTNVGKVVTGGGGGTQQHSESPDSGGSSSPFADAEVQAGGKP